MTGLPHDGQSPRRLRVEVRGVVQGVGFRPHVHMLARCLGLSGAVWNDAAGVVAEVQGDPAAVAAFAARVGAEAPPLALVTEVTSHPIPPVQDGGFTIRPSERTAGRTFVSPDVTICADCLAELADAADRRYRHPFITCTNCGPRFTITTGLPYDRPTTTMAGFPMCPTCAREYADPADRRFHAQTICCPDCGPRLAMVRGPGQAPVAREEHAIRQARALLAAGAVVAVKGIGGYHLACNAADESAVALLRKRKQRGDKPFALMVRDAAAAVGLVELDETADRLLTGAARPVVLARRRPRASVAPSVAPGSGDLGVMLAYTPLHHLLLGLPGDPPGPDVLVLTSGNLAGEPIVTDDAEALTRLSALADAWLLHDRPIHVPCDDSVTRAVAGREAPVRRSRGHAPLPLALPFETPPALAVGADLKNALCLGEGRLAWMSAHIGDMDDLATLAAFDQARCQLAALTGVEPRAVAADRHPAYRSRGRALATGLPLVEVQHHHAHVAATMAEHGLETGMRVLGVAFDGTGYGDDGAAWGGELLLADYAGYERIGHLAYVPLPGGDAGVRNPCRMALSHLRAAGVPWNPALPAVAACAEDELRLLDRQLTTGLRCAPTSSMGRLFDAVSSLAGICHRAGYDAQAAMELEACARVPTDEKPGYRFVLSEGRWDAGPVVAAVAADVLHGVPAAVVAARFQRGVVDLVTTAVTTAASRTGIRTVTLSGGVFLNAYLTQACAADLAERGLDVLTHEQVPASDAGLALGQLAVLAHHGAQHTEEEPACV